MNIERLIAETRNRALDKAKTAVMARRPDGTSLYDWLLETICDDLESLKFVDKVSAEK